MLDDYLPDQRPQPRKRPRQDRSTITVDAILEAAAQLLVAGEREALTTTLVAERAGVSVGTLYQYFPDLDAVLAELVGRHLDRERRALEAVLQEGPALPIGALVDRLIDAFVGVFEEDPALACALYGELRRASWQCGLDERGRGVVSAVADLLRRRSDEIGPSDPALAAFVLVSAVDEVAQRASAQRPDDVASGAVAREAKRMARSYLLVDGERSAPLGLGRASGVLNGGR